ncbi:MAG TPA: hypothetical protein VK886_17550 [Vicinamibacterales bacterium]|nr:hypothetical protein [Vicinamibacterales bacterium]
MSVALVPVPAVASETTPEKKAGTIKASIQKAVAQEVAAMSGQHSVTRRAEQADPSKGSVAFFRTGPGIVALIVMAVGTGYAIYSAQHDRITSPAKE